MAEKQNILSLREASFLCHTVADYFSFAASHGKGKIKIFSVTL
jgi:hypothetical protein